MSLDLDLDLDVNFVKVLLPVLKSVLEHKKDIQQEVKSKNGFINYYYKCGFILDLSNGLCNIIRDTYRRHHHHNYSKYSTYFENYNKILKEITKLFKKWEHYSGNEYYPIVLKSSPLSSSQIYNYYVIRRLSMWGLDEYGQLRWNLIKFLISEIIKDINSSVIDQTIY